MSGSRLALTRCWMAGLRDDGGRGFARDWKWRRLSARVMVALRHALGTGAAASPSRGTLKPPDLVMVTRDVICNAGQTAALLFSGATAARLDGCVARQRAALGVRARLAYGDSGSLAGGGLPSSESSRTPSPSGSGPSRP